MRLSILVLTCLLLSSCVTTYGPAGGLTDWGYQDKQTEPGIYQIVFKATEVTNPRDVVAYWHRRAVELCGHDHYWYEMEENVHHYTDSGYHHLYYDVQGVAKCNMPRQPAG